MSKGNVNRNISSFDEIKTQLFVSHLNLIDITLFMIICWWITIKWLFSLWFGLKKKPFFFLFIYFIYFYHCTVFISRFYFKLLPLQSHESNLSLFFHSLFYLLPLSSLLFVLLSFFVSPCISRTCVYYAQFFIHFSVRCASERGVWLRSF